MYWRVPRHTLMTWSYDIRMPTPEGPTMPSQPIIQPGVAVRTRIARLVLEEVAAELERAEVLLT
jgi:hypothetical protein